MSVKAKPPPTAEAIAGFVAKVEAGEHPFNAARDVGETLTHLRRFGKRGGSDAASAVAEALDEWKLEAAERLAAERYRRALDPEAGKHGASNRVLHYESIVLDDQYRELQAYVRHEHRHSGTIAHVLWDPAKLAEVAASGEFSEAELRAFPRIWRALMATPMPVGGETPALGAGHPDVEAA